MVQKAGLGVGGPLCCLSVRVLFNRLPGDFKDGDQLKWRRSCYTEVMFIVSVTLGCVIHNVLVISGSLYDGYCLSFIFNSSFKEEWNFLVHRPINIHLTTLGVTYISHFLS